MAYDLKLAERIRYVKPFDLTGKPRKGWLVVAAEGCKTEKQLSAWMKEGLEFASTLPSK